MVTNGGRNAAGVGNEKPATAFSEMAAIGCIFSSCFRRDCACLAFDAFARNLSTKL